MRGSWSAESMMPADCGPMCPKGHGPLVEQTWQETRSSFLCDILCTSCFMLLLIYVLYFFALMLAFMLARFMPKSPRTSDYAPPRTSDKILRAQAIWRPTGGVSAGQAGVSYTRQNYSQHVNLVFDLNSELLENTAEILHRVRVRQDELENPAISRHEQIMAGMLMNMRSMSHKSTEGSSVEGVLQSQKSSIEAENAAKRGVFEKDCVVLFVTSVHH